MELNQRLQKILVIDDNDINMTSLSLDKTQLGKMPGGSSHSHSATHVAWVGVSPCDGGTPFWYIPSPMIRGHFSLTAHGIIPLFVLGYPRAMRWHGTGNFDRCLIRSSHPKIGKMLCYSGRVSNPIATFILRVVYCVYCHVLFFSSCRRSDDRSRSHPDFSCSRLDAHTRTYTHSECVGMKMSRQEGDCGSRSETSKLRGTKQPGVQSTAKMIRA